MTTPNIIPALVDTKQNIKSPAPDMKITDIKSVSPPKSSVVSKPVETKSKTIETEIKPRITETDTKSKQKTTETETETKNNTDDSEVEKKVIYVDKALLKTLIIEWLALDDKIRSIKEIMKDKNEEKKQYETQILELMNVLNQEIILTDKGNIVKNKKESKGSLSPELVKMTLTEILKCEETAETYTNLILERRKGKEMVSLKRELNENKKKQKINKREEFKKQISD